MIAGILIALLAGLAAFAVTLAIRRNAAGLGLIASPNERSSHTHPTASGGCVGIVAGGLVASLPFVLASPWPAGAIVGLSLVMAVIGFIDDRRHIPAAIRLAAQLILVAGLVAVLPLDRFVEALVPASLYLAVAVPLIIAAVYWVNLFNFMDGIDGIAGAQAAFMLLAAAVLLLGDGTPLADSMLWWIIGIAAATTGFLTLNWPPARIFMGDAGSTWLGFIIAALAYWTMATGAMSLFQWLILGALFIADTTITLVRRLARGESPFRAHRLHAYQHLSRRWGDHAPVTLLYLAVNVVLLLPLAWASRALPGTAWVAVIAAYIPLVAGLLWAGAGSPEKKSAEAGLRTSS